LESDRMADLGAPWKRRSTNRSWKRFIGEVRTKCFYSINQEKLST